jgi:hypothetical protein
MRIGRRQLIGVFFVTLATLNLEIVLTRIFSVMMRYHFAFLSISLALMGSAVSGAVLYFVPRLAEPERSRRWIKGLALLLAVSIPLTFLLYLQIPLRIDQLREGLPAAQVLWLTLVCLDLTVPFFLSGLIVALTLSAWPGSAGRVYWADLSGAAAGCLVSVVSLEVLGGGGALLAAGALAALSAVVLSPTIRLRQLVAPVAVLLATGVLIWGNASRGWIVISTKMSGQEEPPRMLERWNTHSMVTVYETQGYPFFWSVSPSSWNQVVEVGDWLPHALLLIDAVAGTPIQEFHGDFSQVTFLSRGLTSLVYRLAEEPSTLVIGPGGGRDVLAALVAGAPHVTAVEVNPAVVEAVRGPYGDFSGHLYDRPDVSVHVADARGFVARSTERYDVIQASLIDTWAAGGSGAFALSENSLYTVEAFRAYYEHLSGAGMLSVSRWYIPQNPAEILRLASTAMAGWSSAGVIDPRDHVIVVTQENPYSMVGWLGTAIFTRAPVTTQQTAALQEQAELLDFIILYAPGLELEGQVAEFVRAEDRSAAISSYPLDVSPATDDRPFFFNLFRFGDLLDPPTQSQEDYGRETVLFLACVLAITALMAAFFILVPLGLAARRRGLARPPRWLLVFFGALGAGFMLVEMPTIQRLTVYLGRPVYSLAVVLFSLLLFSSLGGLYSQRRLQVTSRGIGLAFAALVVLIGVQAICVPWALTETMGWVLGARLAVAVAFVAPLGLLMGMPFPTVMRWAGSELPGVVGWLWGVNGVTSVLGSTLAMTLGIHVGLRAVLIAAAALYALAGVVLVSRVPRTQGARQL